MIDLGLSYSMPFSTLFQLICGGHCIYSCFPGVLLTSIRTILYPSHWLLSHKTVESSERGMNAIAMNNINPWKELAKPGIEPAMCRLLNSVFPRLVYG